MVLFIKWFGVLVVGFVICIVFFMVLVGVVVVELMLKVGVIVIGVLFMFFDVKSNLIQGMMVDVIIVVGKLVGFCVDVQQIVFFVLILLFIMQKIDIILVVMLKMLVCQQVVDFFDIVYMFGEGLIVKVDDFGCYMLMDDFKGQVVGVQVGMVFVDVFNKKGIFKEVWIYDLIVDIMCDVVFGCIKVGFVDQLIVVYQIEYGVNCQVWFVFEYQSVVKGQVCFIVCKGDIVMFEQFNGVICKMKGDGMLQQILQKWYMS